MTPGEAADVLERWRSRTAAAGVRHMKREMAARERNRKAREALTLAVEVLAATQEAENQR